MWKGVIGFMLFSSDFQMGYTGAQWNDRSLWFRTVLFFDKNLA